MGGDYLTGFQGSLPFRRGEGDLFIKYVVVWIHSPQKLSGECDWILRAHDITNMPMLPLYFPI